mmetsp:Transcript_47767/g.139319  ORF Transcript_47767/g.139319 Transcript_47767/m.139319 type:complete len:221 (+) Transcript_47767:1796-2458(+)
MPSAADLQEHAQHRDKETDVGHRGRHRGADGHRYQWVDGGAGEWHQPHNVGPDRDEQTHRYDACQHHQDAHDLPVVHLLGKPNVLGVDAASLRGVVFRAQENSGDQEHSVLHGQHFEIQALEPSAQSEGASGHGEHARDQQGEGGREAQQPRVGVAPGPGEGPIGALGLHLRDLAPRDRAKAGAAAREGQQRQHDLGLHAALERRLLFRTGEGQISSPTT